MDSVNNVSESIINPVTSLGTSGNVEMGTGTGIFDKIKNMGIVTWILIIFILAFLGFNVFVYLAEGTQEVTGVFRPLFQSIINFIRYITGKTLIVASEGGEDVLNVAGKISDAGLDGVKKVGEVIEPNNASSSLPNNNMQQSQNTSPDNVTNNALNKAINSAQSRKQKQSIDYEADEANSSIQGGGKSGWCYIGEDRGFRSCALVGVNDTCMSGDIFPSQEICVNPNLRQ